MHKSISKEFIIICGLIIWALISSLTIINTLKISKKHNHKFIKDLTRIQKDFKGNLGYKIHIPGTVSRLNNNEFTITSTSILKTYIQLKDELMSKGIGFQKISINTQKKEIICIFKK